MINRFMNLQQLLHAITTRYKTMWRDVYSFSLLIFTISNIKNQIQATDNFIEDRSVMLRFAIEAIAANEIGSNPSRITAFLCLKKDELNSVVRLASKNHVSINVKNLQQVFDNDYKIFSRDTNLHQIYYLLDVDCFGAYNILKKANSSGMFIGPRKWLLLKESRENKYITNQKDETRIKNNSEVYNFFNKISLYPDSDVSIGQRVENNLIKLVSIYRPSPVRDLIIENRGYWKDGKGLYLNSVQPASIRRKNLQGTPLKSCLVITEPDTINHLNDFYDKHVDTIAKVNYPWILFLVEIMNATVSFTIVDSWGYRGSNNSWSGMIGMLDRKEIDLGGTAVFFTSERTDVIEYVSLYTPTRAKFIFRRPPLSYVSNIFVLPFRPNVWMASGIFLILVAGLLYVAWKWESYTMTEKEKEKRYRNGETVSVTWSDNVLIMIGAVSQQGSTFEPRGVSPRIILLMLFLAVLSLYTSYSANIVALLQSSTDSINSLDKLLKSSLKIGVHDNVYNRHYFAAFQDPIRKAIYEQKVVPKGQKPAWMSIEEGVERLRGGLFAFHAECGAAYKLVQETYHEDEKCGFEEIDYLHVLDPLLAIQKRSPYLEIIKVGVLKIRESGLQTRHITRLYTKKPICLRQTSFVSVGLIDCYSAFAVLAWGALLSLIVFFLETICRRKQNFQNIYT